MCVLCWAGVAAAGRMSPLGAILLKPRIIDTLGSGEEPAAAAGGLAPPTPPPPFPWLQQVCADSGAPDGSPRWPKGRAARGRGFGLCTHCSDRPGGIAGPTFACLEHWPVPALLHLPSHQLSPSAEKSQAPAFHVTSPPSPVLLCPQSHSGGRRLPFPANALAVGCHPRGLCCVWRR